MRLLNDDKPILKLQKTPILFYITSKDTKAFTI